MYRSFQGVYRFDYRCNVCVAVDIQMFDVVDRAFPTKKWEEPHCRSFLDAVDIARELTCSEEADDGNWITGIKNVRFHLRFALLHYSGNIAWYCLFVTSRAISKTRNTVVNRFAIVPFYSFENQQLSFCPRD